jgi:hypothetical protein
VTQDAPAVVPNSGFKLVLTFKGKGFHTVQVARVGMDAEVTDKQKKSWKAGAGDCPAKEGESPKITID